MQRKKSGRDRWMQNTTHNKNTDKNKRSCKKTLDTARGYEDIPIEIYESTSCQPPTHNRTALDREGKGAPS